MINMLVIYCTELEKSKKPALGSRVETFVRALFDHYYNIVYSEFACIIRNNAYSLFDKYDQCSRRTTLPCSTGHDIYNFCKNSLLTIPTYSICLLETLE